MRKPMCMTQTNYETLLCIYQQSQDGVLNGGSRGAHDPLTGWD